VAEVSTIPGLIARKTKPSAELSGVLGYDHVQRGGGDRVGRFSSEFPGQCEPLIPDAAADREHIFRCSVLEEREKCVGAVDHADGVVFEL
jgi:hypothetical protein